MMETVSPASVAAVAAAVAWASANARCAAVGVTNVEKILVFCNIFVS